MGINFPSSPTPGQKLTVGKVVYTYTNGVWRADSLPTALPFNYLINPSFALNQQGTPSSVTGAFYADQWQSAPNPAGTVQFSRLASPSINGSPYVWKNQVLTAKASWTGGEYMCSTMQLMEGNRTAPWRWGSAAAQQIILRFWATGTPGTYSAAFRNYPASDRAYVASFTIDAAPPVVKEVVIVVPGCTTGTWPVDNTYSVSLLFTWGMGTQYGTPTANTWITGNYFGLTTQSNLTTAIGQQVTLQDIGIYLDPDKTGRAPPWQPTEVARAHLDSLRWWTKTELRGVSSQGTSATRMGSCYMVDMRVGPAYAIVGVVPCWDQASSQNSVSIGGPYPNTHYAECELNTAAVQTPGRANFNPPDAPAHGTYIANSAR